MIEEYGHISDAFHLSEQEVENLRKSKKELTEYGKQKFKEMMTEKTLTIDEMMDIANQREEANQKNFYQYLVIDHFETGLGRTIFLQISRNNYSNEFYQQKWEKFIDNKYLLQDVEELTETQFLERYTRMLPNAILRLHREKTLTIWQQHFHFNRS